MILHIMSFHIKSYYIISYYIILKLVFKYHIVYLYIYICPKSSNEGKNAGCF